jgi:hypothetical protein
MAINFDILLEKGEEIVLHPREIFLTLPRSDDFAFLRDVQTEVLEEWFKVRDRKDTVIKLNVGSGKGVRGFRVIDENRLSALKKAVVEFVTSISATGTFNDVKKVRDALTAFGLSEDKLLETFTVAPKQ